MECNREEALRAKEVAVKKFEENDFAGCRRFLEKAERIFPGLEGLQHMLAVLNVHTVAQEKVGSESNWYGILQVDISADDTSIKKQYRKLALSLHPDKNNAVGAEAAFKLVSEAFSVLSDKNRRALHDMRRKLAIPATSKPSTAGTTAQPASYPQYTPPAPWLTVVCAHCASIFACSVLFKDKPVQCHRCHKWFVATVETKNPMGAGTWRPSPTYNFQGQGCASTATGPAGVNGSNATSTQGWWGGAQQPRPYNQPPMYTQQQAEHYQKWQTSDDPNLQSQQRGGPAMNSGAGQPGVAGGEPPFGSDAFVRNVWDAVQKTKVADAERRKKEKEDKKLEKEMKRKAKEEEDKKKREEKERKDREKQEQIAKAQEAKEAARKRNLEILQQKKMEQERKQEERRKEVGKSKDSKGTKRRRKVKEDDEEDEDGGEDYDVLLDDDVEILGENGVREEGIAQANGNGFVRRSSRRKAHVHYRVDDSDDEGEMKGAKGAKQRKSSAECPGQDIGLGTCAPSVPPDTASRCVPAKVVDAHPAPAPAPTSADGPAPAAAPVSNRDASNHGQAVPQPYPATGATKPAPVPSNSFRSDPQPASSAHDQHHEQRHRPYQCAPGASFDQARQETGFVSAKQAPAASRTQEHMQNGGGYGQGHGRGVPEQRTAQQQQQQQQQQQGHSQQAVPKTETDHGRGDPTSADPAFKGLSGLSKESSANEETKESKEEEEIPLQMEVPDPDFHNFDDDRLEKDVKDGQIWAMYDDTDGMPRFYARILHAKVSEQACSWRTVWLEGVEATGKELDGQTVALGCGEYKNGKTGRQTSVSVFSHPMVAECSSSNGRHKFWIRPRKDEVWALFRSDPKPTGWNGLHDGGGLTYDLVLVLGDYVAPAGVEVCYLTKLMGFKTLFTRNLERSSVRIGPPDLTRRFSHKVPSHACTGAEGPDVPQGALELDPASIPMELLFATRKTSR